jgi:hypothetical protein
MRRVEDHCIWWFAHFLLVHSNAFIYVYIFLLHFCLQEYVYRWYICVCTLFFVVYACYEFSLPPAARCGPFCLVRCNSLCWKKKLTLLLLDLQLQKKYLELFFFRFNIQFLSQLPQKSLKEWYFQISIPQKIQGYYRLCAIHETIGLKF